MENVSLLAVLIAAVLNMVVGALWYGKIFGASWMKGMGMTEEDANMEPMHMVITFVGHLGLAAAVAALLSAGGVESTGGAIQAAIWLWLGLVATTMTINQVWDSRPWSLLGINAGNHLVSMLIAALVATMM
jgi:hypothetical protein